MSTKDKVKIIVGLVIIITSVIALIACAIAGLVFYIKNPDMTSMRRLIEYPLPSVIAVVAFLCNQIGIEIIKSVPINSRRY